MSLGPCTALDSALGYTPSSMEPIGTLSEIIRLR